MEDWYNQIDEPVRDLVYTLRNVGFNTVCSCGHLPNPYVQIEWYEDSQVTQVRNLLIEHGYKNFEIYAQWPLAPASRVIEIRFCPPQPLVGQSEIRGPLPTV